MRSIAPLRAAKIGYIVMSVLFCLLGLVLLVWPNLSISLIGIAAGIMLIVFGLVKLGGYFTRDLYELAFQHDLDENFVRVADGKQRSDQDDDEHDQTHCAGVAVLAELGGREVQLQTGNVGGVARAAGGQQQDSAVILNRADEGGDDEHLQLGRDQRQMDVEEVPRGIAAVHLGCLEQILGDVDQAAVEHQEGEAVDPGEAHEDDL